MEFLRFSTIENGGAPPPRPPSRSNWRGASLGAKDVSKLLMQHSPVHVNESVSAMSWFGCRYREARRTDPWSPFLPGAWSFHACPAPRCQRVAAPYTGAPMTGAGEAEPSEAQSDPRSEPRSVPSACNSFCLSASNSSRVSVPSASRSFSPASLPAPALRCPP